MPTIAAGQTVTVYVPLPGSVTLTPGSGGKISFNGRNADGSAVLPREIYTAISIDLLAGATFSAEAIGADASYTEPGLTTSQVAALTAATTTGALDLPASYSLGSLLVKYDTAAGGGTTGATRITDGSEACPDPDSPDQIIRVPFTASNASVYDHIPTVATDISTVKTLGIWLRAIPRVDGERFTMVKILFAASTTDFVNFGQATVCVQADGRWRLHTLNPDQISVGAGTWTKATPVARYRFREGDAGTATNRAQMSSGDVYFVGPIRANPKQKAIGLVRFDDGLSNLFTSKSVNVAATFTGQSGVTITAGSTYSMADIVSAFGMVANAYVLTDLIGGAGFETVAGLKSLQTMGWDICFQSAANPVGGIGAGVRLLGPYGYDLVAPGRITAVNTVNGQCTTSGTENGIGGTSAGQYFPVTAIGTNLPPELVAGQTYWLFRVNGTVFTIHSQGIGSLDGVTGKIIPSNAGTLANWGFRYLGAANDHTAIQAEFQRGYDWLIANGFSSSAEHYAPNQGAWDIYSERAFYAFGKFKTVSMIGFSNGPGACVPIFEPVATHAAANDTTSAEKKTLQAAWINLTNVFQTDVATSATESVVRARVRAAVSNGWVISNFHHGQSFSTVLDMLWYLDELKLWRDRGMIDVLKVSDAWRRISSARVRLSA